MYYDKIKGSGFRSVATLLAIVYVIMGFYFPFFCDFKGAAIKEYYTSPVFYLYFVAVALGMLISINTKATDVAGIVAFFVPTYYSLTEYSNIEGVSFDMMIPNAIHLGVMLLMILVVFFPGMPKLVFSYICAVLNALMLLLTTIKYSDAIQIVSNVDTGWYANIYNLVRVLAILMVSFAFIRESKKEIYNKQMSKYY